MDTQAIQLHIDSFTTPAGDFDITKDDHVISFINQAAKTTDLFGYLLLSEPPGADSVQFSNFATSMLSEQSYSTVAYIECKAGYIFVMEALADHVSLVFNRFD